MRSKVILEWSKRQAHSSTSAGPQLDDAEQLSPVLGLLPPAWWPTTSPAEARRNRMNDKPVLGLLPPAWWPTPTEPAATAPSSSPDPAGQHDLAS
jgi:hypothetical protein